MQAPASHVPAHIYIWDNRVLYAGPSIEPRYRNYGSAALVVGVEGNLRLHRQTHANEVVEARACLIRPGLPVWLESDSPSFMVLFLDPFQHDLRALAKTAAHQDYDIFWSLAGEGQLIDLARYILKASPAPQAILAGLVKAGLPDIDRLDPEGVDPRVVKAVGVLRGGRTQSITTEDLAATVSLSVPRVIQLFRQYLGISAGKYRQWHRLHATTLAIGHGQTFTQASVASGFSDLAHFSNTFHSMMGIMPSRLFRSNGGVRFHIDPRLSAQGFSALSGIDSAVSTMC
ncbi:helix-turn-helix domain-containing protein [Marinobacter lacisalsi]|uniref:Helix-turn-helix domain-containing protein n=1 Tax=Marinobacter lacisalsi TaxID=475979 RepID=A0ABV8QGL5_9GAMM